MIWRVTFGSGRGSGMNFLKPEKGMITLIVGRAGTGKTSLVLQFAREFSIPFIVDSEGISVKRIEQIGALNARIARVTSFEQQHATILNFHERCDFFAVDSLVMLYRLALAGDPKKANALLAEQMAKLAEMAIRVPVVVTGHIYEKNGKRHIVSGDVAAYWAKKIVLLEKEGRKRRAILLKHPHEKEKQVVKYEITGNGVRFL